MCCRAVPLTMMVMAMTATLTRTRQRRMVEVEVEAEVAAAGAPWLVLQVEEAAMLQLVVEKTIWTTFLAIQTACWTRMTRQHWIASNKQSRNTTSYKSFWYSKKASFTFFYTCHALSAYTTIFLVLPDTTKAPAVSSASLLMIIMT